jgi:hypothetical protein
MGYLADFMAKLNASSIGKGASVQRSPRSALWDILGGKLTENTSQNAEWHNWKPTEVKGGPSVGSVAGSAASGAWNAIGKAIDIAERPFYASSAMMEEGVKQGVGPASYINTWSLLNAIAHGKGEQVAKAGLEGFIGQRHTTTADVTSEMAKHDNLLGDITRLGNANPITKFTMNIVGDLGLDPISYIPGGAIGAATRGGTRAALGAVGKDLPKIMEKGGVKARFRTKNAVTSIPEESAAQFKDAPTPEKAAEQSITQTGVAKVNSEISDKVLNKVNAPTIPINVPEHWQGPIPESLSNTARLLERDKKLTLQPGEGTLIPPEGKQLAAAQVRLAGHKATAADILKPFETPKYAPDVAIHPFHMEEAGVPKKVTTEEAVTKDVPISGSPQQEVKKSFEQILEPKTFIEGKVSVFNDAGKKLAHDPNTGAIPRNLRTHKPAIPFEHILQAALENKPLPASWKNAHIQASSGQLIPIHTFVKMLRDKAKTAKAIGKQTKKVTTTEKVTKEIPTVRRRKLTNLERMIWEGQHKHLAPEDIATLRAAGMKSYKAFDEAVSAVKSATVTKEYKSLDELAADIANGTASKAVTDELKKRMGAKKLDTLIKNLKKEEAAVAGHTGKELEKEAKAFAGTETTDIAAKRAEIEAKQGLPNPEGNPEVIQEAAAKIDKAEATGTPVKPSAVRDPKLDEWQTNTVRNALVNSNKSQFNEAKQWGYRSKSGAHKNEPGYYEGKARWLRSFNKRSQFTMTQEILKEVSKKVSGIKDVKAYAAAKYDTAMPMLHAAEQLMRENGIEPILGTGRHGRGYPMSMHDVLSSLPRDFVEKYFFDVPWTPKSGKMEGKVISSNFAPSQLSDIAEQFVHLHLGNKSVQQVEEAVRGILKSPLNKTGAESHVTARINRQEAARLEPMVKATMDAFNTALPKLGERLTENIAKASVDEANIAHALSEEAISAYDAVVMNPAFSPGRHMQAALESHTYVDAAARAHNIPEHAPAVDHAHEAIDAHMAETVPAARLKIVENSTEQLAKATTKNEAVKAGQIIADGAHYETSGMIARDGGNIYDFGVNAETGLMMGTLTRLVPDIGNEQMHTYLLNYTSAAQTYVKDHAQVLARINHTYTDAQITDAWNSLKTLEKDATPTPVQQDLMVAIKDMIDVVPNGKFGFFTRNVHDPAQLMEDYRKYGVPEDITLNPDDLENSWRDWPAGENGVLDTISRVNASHTHAVAKHSMGADLSQRFGHPTGGPGRVKIVDSTGNSELAKYINTNLWYDEDVARQFHMLDETLKALKKGGPSGKLGKNLRNLDIATQMWKAGVTIYRPGHHARNAVGDIWLSAMDGVTPKYYTRSLSVMQASGKKHLDFDALRASAPIGGPSKLPDTVLSMPYKGQMRHFSAAQVHQMADRAGALPSFDIIEDVSLKTDALDPRRASGIVGKVQQMHLPGKFEGKAHKIATKTSEGREHYIRIAHFLKAMEDTTLKGKTLEDAIRNSAMESASRVRKFHPDGSDLTQFERTYMRRIIPFYSWVRKAIPLVIETGVAKPGKVMIYPKAMYDWAEAQGVDLQSYGNPFPTDQLFPSWIADSTQGPQWGATGMYGGIKPGIPSADIADDYLANPGQLLKTLAGSLHPFARVPIELMSGNKLRTRGPISDLSDYIDAQIPLGTYADQLIGNRSVSTLGIQANKESPSNIGFNNPSMPPGASFLNYLTGAGLTDYSKPSYQKYAQLEQKRAGG